MGSPPHLVNPLAGCIRYGASKKNFPMIGQSSVSYG